MGSEEPLYRAILKAVVIAVVLVLLVWGISSFALDKFAPLYP